MEGLTAKVFRTYNASITLQQQLNELMDPDFSEAEKVNSKLITYKGVSNHGRSTSIHND
jgi:Eukaryotic DNA topoisomerase I, catalytic core.